MTNTPTSNNSFGAISGLDALKLTLSGQRDGPGIAKVLNYEMESVEEGSVTFVGAPKSDIVNPMGSVHGGFYGAMLDSCMACSVASLVPAGSSYTTLEYKVNIIRPIGVGMRVRATGKAQHVGRSTGVATGEIRGVEDGKLYATGTTTCIVMQIPRKG